MTVRSPVVTLAMLMRLGWLHLNSKNFFDAKDTFIKACRMEPTASSWLGLGEACVGLGEFSQAEEALSEANILDHLNPTIWGWITLVCLRSNKQDEADQAFQEALKQDLQDGPLLLDVGLEYKKVGQLSVAEGAARRALKHAVSALGRKLLGDIQVEQNQLDAAVDSYKQALEMSDLQSEDKTSILKAMVKILQKTNRVEEAREYHAQLS